MNFPATVYLGHITLSVLWKCTGPINEFILWLSLCREAERERVRGGAKLQMWTLICEWPLVLILPNWNLGQWRHNLFPLPLPLLLLGCSFHAHPTCFPSLHRQGKDLCLQPAHIWLVCVLFSFRFCAFSNRKGRKLLGLPSKVLDWRAMTREGVVRKEAFSTH